MIFKDYFLILSAGHIIADFYLQSTEMSQKKEQKMRWVLLHSLVYWVGMLIVMLPFLSWNMFVIASLTSATHCLIDIWKFLYKKYHKKDNQIKVDRNTFVVDQLLHLGCLFIISYIATVADIRVYEAGCVRYFFDTIQVSEKQFLTWLLAFLLIYRPADIFIQKILKSYKPTSELRQSDIIVKDNNTGRIIGMIERTIMLVFLAIGQYSSVGLVLTAKSIARYDKISSDKDFAEYYLLGTLLSTIIVVISSFIIV